jgi:Ni/Fe-hydrogenase subunit HybB-like protein
MNAEQNGNTPETTREATPATSQETKPKKYNLRIIGLAFFAAGVFLMVMNWRSVFTDGSYWIYATFLAPLAICWGLAMILAKKTILPDGKTEFTALNQRAFTGLGIILGIFNWLFISGILPLPF